MELRLELLMLRCLVYTNVRHCHLSSDRAAAERAEERFKAICERHKTVVPTNIVFLAVDELRVLEDWAVDKINNQGWA